MTDAPRYTIRNWEKFQHYRQRRPPWIKLYRHLLEDPAWVALPPEEAKVLIGLWLLAAEDTDDSGALPPTETAAFRLRMDSKALAKILERLEAKSWVCQNASKPLAQCKQHATPETETETEREAEREAEAEVEREREDNNKSTNQHSKSAEMAYIIFDTWNAAAGAIGARKAQDLNDKRKATIKARLKSPFWRDNWRAALKRWEDSPFLCGKCPPTDRWPKVFKGSLDFFLKPNTVSEIMEGKYDDERNSKSHKLITDDGDPFG